MSEICARCSKGPCVKSRTNCNVFIASDERERHKERIKSEVGPMSEERKCKYFKLYAGITNRDTLLVPRCESPSPVDHNNIDNGGCNNQCAGFIVTDDLTIQSLTAQLAEARSALESVDGLLKWVMISCAPDTYEPIRFSDSMSEYEYRVTRGKVTQALSLTPSDALAGYQKMERVVEAAADMSRALQAGVISVEEFSGAQDALEQALRELEEVPHA